MADMPQDLCRELEKRAAELTATADHFREMSYDDEIGYVDSLRAEAAWLLHLAGQVPDDVMADLTRWQKRWGGLRRWLKEQMRTWQQPCLAAQVNHRQIHVSAYRSLLHEMDQTRMGNRAQQREDDLVAVPFRKADGVRFTQPIRTAGTGERIGLSLDGLRLIVCAADGECYDVATDDIAVAVLEAAGKARA